MAITSQVTTKNQKQKTKNFNENKNTTRNKEENRRFTYHRAMRIFRPYLCANANPSWTS